MSKAEADKATRLKDQGNTLFKQGKFTDALAKYSQGIVLHYVTC